MTVEPRLVMGILARPATTQGYSPSAVRAGDHRRSIGAGGDEGVMVQSIFHCVVSVVGQA